MKGFLLRGYSSKDMFNQWCSNDGFKSKQKPVLLLQLAFFICATASSVAD